MPCNRKLRTDLLTLYYTFHLICQISPLFLKSILKSPINIMFSCVYVCVCLYSFTVKASSVCNDVWDILEGTLPSATMPGIYLRERFHLQRCLGYTWGNGSPIFCCEYYSKYFCQVPSSPFLNMSYLTPNNETLAADKLAEKRYDIWQPAKRWYILI